ncbi:MAG: hypothetical protein HKN82_05570 [Akkermansiaceae bacterium]|nr:hypothetical protein [Akkermansiaceae bacterium]NNM28918.1 hypothetical protein [Akkermansiaceae bacterium]
MRSRWKSIEQLADLWGLSRARTSKIVQILVRTGRMEARPGTESAADQEFRVLPR